MLVLLFLLSVSAESCLSQYVYGGVVPYDSRYAGARRPPVRRSAIEALERLRLPVARYFPQVDTQVPRAPYPYQWATGDVYALPPQWADDFVPQIPQEEEEAVVPDYNNYEYDAAFNNYGRQVPPYAEEVYPQEVDPEAADASIYNDLMSSYLMSGGPDQQDAFDNVQRRSETTDTGVVQLPKDPEVKNGAATPNASTPTPQPPTQTPAPVQMTAVPAAPSKKGVKSLVVPAPPSSDASSSSQAGQKEEPLFRPLQSSQRTSWNDLHRVNKNSAHYENPIPLLKQMMNKEDNKAKIDPLLEELTNLKKMSKV